MFFVAFQLEFILSLWASLLLVKSTQFSLTYLYFLVPSPLVTFQMVNANVDWTSLRRATSFVLQASWLSCGLRLHFLLCFGSHILQRKEIVLTMKWRRPVKQKPEVVSYLRAHEDWLRGNQLCPAQGCQLTSQVPLWGMGANLFQDVPICIPGNIHINTNKNQH